MKWGGLGINEVLQTVSFLLSQECWLPWEEGVNILCSVIAKGQDNRSQTQLGGWPNISQKENLEGLYLPKWEPTSWVPAAPSIKKSSFSRVECVAKVGPQWRDP